MSHGAITLAVPSKGRLMERTREIFAGAGLRISKIGHERGYRGRIDAMDGIDVAFLSASEIAHQLRPGRTHPGVTGAARVGETIADIDARVEFVRPLGFGRADVVVAVPECWIDVSRMSDLEDVAAIFQREHGHRLRVATKYLNLTRRFFAEHGVMGYRIVESLGATEGTPADGIADIIVDITSTGTTLRANHLRVLEDGVLLKSEATLLASRTAEPQEALEHAKSEISTRLQRAA